MGRCKDMTKSILKFLGVPLFLAVLIGATYNTGRFTVEVEDVADGIAHNFLGWDGSGVATSISLEGARVFHGGNQSIPNSTNTFVTFDGEQWDDNDLHDTVTNNSRITVKVPGRYLITANIYFTGNATGARQLKFKVNGSAQIGAINEAPGNATDFLVAHAVIWELAVDDYVEVEVLQNSGGALNIVNFGDNTNEFAVQMLRGN